MTEQTYHDPDADGVARAAQAAAMSLAIVEALARLQQERTAQRALDDERNAAALRAERAASHASARVAWAPALNERWLRRADVPELLRAWAPATGWSSSDPDAHDAADRTEQRLAAMHPEAMHRYAQARADGLDPAAAMGEAAPAFAAPHPHDTARPDPRIANAPRVIVGQTVPPRPTHQASTRRR